MFERFTHPARAVVVDALERAREDDTGALGEEHLLAAVLSAASIEPLLMQLGLDRDPTAQVLAEIRDARRRGGLSTVDAEALAGLGIDLKTVVGHVEAELGAGALASTRRRRRWWRSRLPVGDAPVPASSGAKRVQNSGDRTRNAPLNADGCNPGAARADLPTEWSPGQPVRRKVAPAARLREGVTLERANLG